MFADLIIEFVAATKEAEQQIIDILRKIKTLNNTTNSGNSVDCDTQIEGNLERRSFRQLIQVMLILGINSAIIALKIVLYSK